MAKLRDADDTMTGAVAKTLDELQPGPLHAATAMLARRYAQLIDEAENLAEAMDEYGPRLFACLESLGAATAPAGGGKPGVSTSRQGLAGLRASRRPR